MSWQPRILEKFENTAGSVSQAFPLADYEWESSQALKVPVAAAVGAHYGVDLMGTNPGLKDFASERLRCTVLSAAPGDPGNVDTDVDAIKSKLHSIGRGKLYAIDHDNVRRWAWARLNSMPALSWRAGMIFQAGLVLDFLRLSDWYSSALTSSSAAATGTVVINNPGNAPVYDAVLTLKGTFTNPKITNTTNGYVLESSRDGSNVAHWLKFDAGRHTVEWSTNSGGAYANDYANFIRAATQVGLMRLEPGNNGFTFTGMTSATLAWSFFGAWH